MREDIMQQQQELKKIAKWKHLYEDTYDKTLHQYDTGNCKFFHTVNPYLEKKMKYFF